MGEVRVLRYEIGVLVLEAPLLPLNAPKMPTIFLRWNFSLAKRHHSNDISWYRGPQKMDFVILIHIMGCFNSCHVTG